MLFVIVIYSGNVIIALQCLLPANVLYYFLVFLFRKSESFHNIRKALQEEMESGLISQMRQTVRQKLSVVEIVKDRFLLTHRLHGLVSPHGFKIDFMGTPFLDELHDFSLLSLNSFLRPFIKSKFLKKNSSRFCTTYILFSIFTPAILNVEN